MSGSIRALAWAASGTLAACSAFQPEVGPLNVRDTGVTDHGSSDAGDAGDAAPCTTLTVKNYSGWCSVSVNGAPAATDPVQVVCAQPGTVPLVAAPSSGTFMLGLWHHTSSDTGSGDPGMVAAMTSSTTVVVSTAATCVWVCCPFANGTGCPATDQCP